MKWKSALTAEEAALFAVGFESYKTLEAARIGVDSPPHWFSREDWEDGYAREIVDHEEEQSAKLTIVEGIHEALLAEISIADPYQESDANSCLVIAQRAQLGECCTDIVCARSTVTKLSLAKWFWQHDHEMAKRFWPSITEELAHPPLVEIPKSRVTAELSTKSKNSYLKTIGALAEALIDGLTGKPNTDAEAILAALASKKVEVPVSNKTLASYLEQSNDM